MEGVSLALSAAQTLLAALQCPDLKEMSSIFEYKSHLEELQNTVSTVKAVLLDAETKQQLSNETHNYIQKLKDAVYDADDLLDEFVTIAQQEQVIQDGKASEKVRLFFSRFNPLVVASKMSKRVKKIKNKLERIASDHNKFGLGIDSHPIKKRREDTCSYVYENNIIGRKDDVSKILSILLDSNVQVQNQQDVSFLSIVGIGGLGKTALAQLLFNDDRVIGAFPKRLWTCISDHEQETLDIEGILRKILSSATGNKHEGLSKEEVQKQLRRELASNKYLLVLDDVWTENRKQWLDLVQYLWGGQRGSWIVVTTRSEKTATIIESNSVHKLQGLSEEDSWHLFKKVAFGLEQSSPSSDLVVIGRKIVQACAGVPLALRVVGSLLYDQDKSKWLSLQKMGLSNLRDSRNDIMPTLMISYHNLESPLKSCFSYCALFPKDFEIQKNLLLSLWMAQGYVVPLDGCQSVEDAAEEYFSILLRRCFFQDVKKNHDTGDIYSCKIHDLMHDLAQKVVAKEIFVSDSLSDHIDEKVRHIAHIGSEAPKYTLAIKTCTRSYVQLEARRDAKVKMDQHKLEALVGKFTSIRALYLRECNVRYLPKSIGNSLHLRYLNMSETELVELPESFINLHNLETLILDGCTKLEKLPEDISKLVKLRVLSVQRCQSLTRMPSDLVKLTNLRVLDMLECKKLTSLPSDLSNLGELRILQLAGCDCLNTMPRGLNKLTNLEILSRFMLKESSPSCKEWFDHLEELKALNNLKGLLRFVIQSPKNANMDCRGVGYLKNKENIHVVYFEFIGNDVDNTTAHTEEALMETLEPHCNLKKISLRGYHGVRMPSWGTSLSNLVKMELKRCIELQELTCLGKLHNLKELRLEDIPKLEYIIEKHTGTSQDDLSFFLPRLKQLAFVKMPKLKGWGIRMSDDDSQSLCLSQLQTLDIVECPELTLFPQCPRVEFIYLYKINDKLDLEVTLSEIPKLRDDIDISTDNMTWLKSQTIEFIQQLTSVCIDRDDKGVESWEAIENGMPWHSLRHLKLSDHEEMESLPKWISVSTSLETLEIYDCKKLETLPTWMSELTSLKFLKINGCSEKLKERYKKHTGENWPYIQHIPYIRIEGETIQEPTWMSELTFLMDLPELPIAPYNLIANLE